MGQGGQSLAMDALPPEMWARVMEELEPGDALSMRLTCTLLRALPPTVVERALGGEPALRPQDFWGGRIADIAARYGWRGVDLLAPPLERMDSWVALCMLDDAHAHLVSARHPLAARAAGRLFDALESHVQLGRVDPQAARRGTIDGLCILGDLPFDDPLRPRNHPQMLSEAVYVRLQTPGALHAIWYRNFARGATSKGLAIMCCRSPEHARAAIFGGPTLAWTTLWVALGMGIFARWEFEALRGRGALTPSTCSTSKAVEEEVFAMFELHSATWLRPTDALVLWALAEGMQKAANSKWCRELLRRVHNSGWVPSPATPLPVVDVGPASHLQTHLYLLNTFPLGTLERYVRAVLDLERDRVPNILLAAASECARQDVVQLVVAASRERAPGRKRRREAGETLERSVAARLLSATPTGRAHTDV
jgi:hypothetical protein